MDHFGDAAAQCGDGDIAHIRIGKRKIAIGPDGRVRVDDPLAVRTEHPDAVFFGPGQKVFFISRPIGTGFRESARVDDNVFDAFLAALLHGLGDELGGDDHVDHIDIVRGLQYRFEGLDSADLVGLRIDGINLPFKPKVLKILDDPVADVQGFGGGADDCHGFGSKQ